MGHEDVSGMIIGSIVSYDGWVYSVEMLSLPRYQSQDQELYCAALEQMKDERFRGGEFVARRDVSTGECQKQFWMWSMPVLSSPWWFLADMEYELPVLLKNHPELFVVFKFTHLL